VVGVLVSIVVSIEPQPEYARTFAACERQLRLWCCSWLRHKQPSFVMGLFWMQIFRIAHSAFLFTRSGHSSQEWTTLTRHSTGY